MTSDQVGGAIEPSPFTPGRCPGPVQRLDRRESSIRSRRHQLSFLPTHSKIGRTTPGSTKFASFTVLAEHYHTQAKVRRNMARITVNFIKQVWLELAAE
jgi:hypothetical protein